ncbi:MAG: cytochrome P450 [Streptosporangiaceae bacterium]
MNYDFAVESLPDLHTVLAQARETAPVVPALFLGERAWLVTRHADVAAAFTDEEAIPSAAAYRLFAEPVQGRTLQCMAGAEHRVNRALVSPAFRPAEIRRLTESVLAPAADQLADSLAGRDRVDLVEEYAARLPFLVITRLLGLSDADLPDLRRWATALFSYSADPAKATEGAAAFTRFLGGLLDSRRQDPQDDLLSQLVTGETVADDGTVHRLTDEEIFSFIRLLFPAGADTTYRAIGSMIYALLAHSGRWEQVRDDPSTRSAAIEETLRWEPPVAIQPRRTTGETRWGVGPDEWILFGTAAANRDPAVFAEPDVFDPGRAPGQLLSFGAGPHYCLGAHLARAEMRAALDALTARFPHLELAVRPDQIRFGDAILRGPKTLRVRLPGTGPRIP